MANDANLGRDWAPGNPWLLMLIALAFTAMGWLLRLLQLAWPERLILILPGLLIGAAGVWIGLSNRGARASFESLTRPMRNLVLTCLGLLFGAAFLGLSACLVLRVFGNESVPWKPGSLVVVWLIAAPGSAAGFRTAWRSLVQGRTRREEEAAALLALAAVICALACWAIEWDTIQMLLAALAFVALVASPLLIVSQSVRRAVVSVVVILHFGGILTAVMATPPMPWLAGQLWTRIYRPYLEFMYLVNAYHYYSPEPGPASFLWFRLIYLDEKDNKHGIWHKVPEFDEQDRPKSSGLAYNRLLALTENITHGTPMTEAWELVKDGQEVKMVPARAFQQRARFAPNFVPALGVPGPPTGALRIPFHPLVPQQQQYIIPIQPVKELVSSYAKHVTRLRHPEHPDWRIQSVKVYRVKHVLAQEGPFMKGVDPREPYFYLPYYYGQYDPDGRLLDPNSPFLYWLVPVLEDNRRWIFDYARRHAGDPRWVREPENKEWIEWQDDR